VNIYRAVPHGEPYDRCAPQADDGSMTFLEIDEVLETALRRAEYDEFRNPSVIGSRLRGIALTRLREVREIVGLTQRELSRMLGRNHDYVGALERGSRGVIGLRNVREIADVLGVYPSNLIDADSFRDYVSPENARIRNLRSRTTPSVAAPVWESAAKDPRGLARIFSGVFARFKRKHSLMDQGTHRGA